MVGNDDYSKELPWQCPHGSNGAYERKGLLAQCPHGSNGAYEGMGNRWCTTTGISHIKGFKKRILIHTHTREGALSPKS